MVKNSLKIQALLAQIGKFVPVIVALYALVVCYNVISKDKQQDFKTYYYAAEAHSANLNPYHLENLNKEGRKSISLPFVYPPLTLYLIKPFTLLPFAVSYYLFFILKLAALAALIWLWYRFFLPDKRFAPLLWIFVAFAFRETIIRDIYAGNISIFEQLFLWSAAYFFVKQRSMQFALCILIASFFKVTLLVFLLLLLLDRDKKAIAAMFAAGLIFLAVNLISFKIQTDLFQSFLANASLLNLETTTNQSSLMLIREVLLKLTDTVDNSLDSAIHIAFAMFALAFARRASFGYNFKENRVDLIMLAFFLYALLMPRMKDYSYILMIIPVLHVMITRLDSIYTRAAVIFIVSVSFLPFQAFLTVLAIFAVYLARLKQSCIVI